MATQNSNQKRSVSYVTLAVFGFLMLFGATANAQDISWNTGDGWFFDANNWTPVGAPQNYDIIRIGNLPAAAGSTVLMGAHPGLAYEELYLSNGVTLDTNGSELISFGDAWITGFGTRLIVRPAPFLNQSDFQGVLHLGQGAHLELRDDVRVTLFPPSESAGTISGRGRMITNAFNNNGIIMPGNNGGLILDAGTIVQDQTVDLDGSLGNGTLQLITQFSQFQVNAGSLTDSFSSSIVMVPGALLEMNIDDGWTADSNSFINVLGQNNPAAASQISGTALTFGGQMTIGGAQGHLRVLAPMTIQNSATVNVGATDWLELDGSIVVQGGQFALGQGAKLQFDGPTTMQGGVFNTHSSNIGDGFVAFNGPTTWNGNVTLNGASRQNGSATVSGGLGAVINAGRFDMDGGLGNTNWNVNGNLVVNADHIGTSGTNRFGGTMNIAGGFLPKLTMNLSDPSASWVMGGTMNLNGFSNLFETRVAGSHMIVEGDLNVTGGRVRINADTTFANLGGGGSANVVVGPADSVLRMSSITTVHSNVSFAGMGTLQNALSGEMNLMDGVSLGSVSLINQGELEIDEKAGIASVHRFENTGTWQVDIGGLLAGTEHDLLIVGGGEAFLGGLLEVDLIDAGSGYFMPEIGDQFTILASLGGVNGTFLNNPISFLDGQFYHWSVLYNPHDVRLQLSGISVPEPGSLLFLASASVLLMFRRRRRSDADLEKGSDSVERITVWCNSGASTTKLRKAFCWLIVSFATAISFQANVASGQIKHWNSPASGNWSNAANWSPIGVPGAPEFALLGSLPGVENLHVSLDMNATVNGLIITDGVRFHLNGHSFQTTLDTTVSGYNGPPWRSVLEMGEGSVFTTRDLLVEDEAWLLASNNSILNVNRTFGLQPGTTFSGSGTINLNRNGANSFDNGGKITVYGGDMIINQLGTGLIDLDGSTGTGTVFVGDGISASALTINGTWLADSFSGYLEVATGSLLNMNLSGGWTADANSQIVIRDSGFGLANARIQGGPLNMSGTVNVFRSETGGSDFAYLTGSFESDVTIEESASVNLGMDTTLEFAGATTINGGNHVVGDHAFLEFSGATTIRGGNFSAQGLAVADGAVLFHGLTEWDGNVVGNGLFIQNGDATVTGSTTITAGVLDMDGFVQDQPTSWNINATTVVNANRIDTLGNYTEAQVNVGGGFLHRLTMNLDSPWVMAGELNLTGNNNFFLSRLAGSEMRVQGELNLASGRAQIDSDVILTGSGTVRLMDESAQLRFSGDSIIQSGAEMLGNGQLRNGVTGQMILEDGANLVHVGLFNQGMLQIGNPDFGSVGVATVDRFENAESGIWNVEIGGLMAGSEHDLLLVSGGPTLLDGLLEVDLIDLGGGIFLPEIGDEFTILYSFGNVSGSFLGDPISQYGDQLFHWSVFYNPHGVTLHLDSISFAVPEPSMFGAVLIAGLVFGGRRRRRHV